MVRQNPQKLFAGGAVRSGARRRGAIRLGGGDAKLIRFAADRNSPSSMIGQRRGALERLATRLYAARWPPPFLIPGEAANPLLHRRDEDKVGKSGEVDGAGRVRVGNGGSDSVACTNMRTPPGDRVGRILRESARGPYTCAASPAARGPFPPSAPSARRGRRTVSGRPRAAPRAPSIAPRRRALRCARRC